MAGGRGGGVARRGFLKGSERPEAGQPRRIWLNAPYLVLPATCVADICRFLLQDRLPAV